MAKASGPPGLSTTHATRGALGRQALSAGAAVVPPPDGPWVDIWLSPARLSRYLTATGGDRQRALALYEWNTQVSAALQRDLAHLEMALRNGYATALDAHWSGPGHWTSATNVLFAPLWRTKKSGPVDVNEKSRKALMRAVHDAGGSAAPPGKIIAQLMLGFWRYLSSSAHEKTLWVPYLHHAFPPGVDRARDVDAPISRLHDLRNRVAHHEPLLQANLLARMADLLNVAGLLHAELKGHLSATTAIPGLLAARP